MYLNEPNMKDKILYSEPLFIFLESFFESRTVSQHIRFLEEWLHLVLTDKFYTKWNNPADILFFYNQFVELYEHSSKLIEDQRASEEVDSNSAARAQLKLSYEPQYLSTEEILNPLLAIQGVFKDYDFAYYKSALYEWLEEALNSALSDIDGAEIFPIYANTKKLIEANWLLLQYLVSKDQQEKNVKTLICFEQTCPLLLQKSYLNDPYKEIESFFSGASLGEYRKDLKDWFRAALIEHVSFKRSSKLIYFHSQLIQLIHAGYLIVNNNLIYQRNEPYCSNANTFKDWIIGVKAKTEEETGVETFNYDVFALSDAEKRDPLQYVYKTLKLKKIKEIRYGLQEWLYCALSKQNSLMDIEDQYILKLYETLEKLLEAFFLLVTGNHLKADFDAEGKTL